LDERPGVLVVRLKGSLDAYLRDFTPDIEKQIRARPRHLVANLASIDFIGSRGMGLLFHLHKVLRDVNCQLVIASPSQPAADALDVGGIGSLLEVFDSEDLAVQALPAVSAGGKAKRAKQKPKRKK
jgi:anti-anti-sigma factor